MHVEGLLSANLCLVTLLSSEQCSQFERFRLQHVWNDKQNIQFQKNRSAIIPRRVNLVTFWCLTFPLSGQQTSRYKLLLGQFWADDLPLTTEIDFTRCANVPGRLASSTPLSALDVSRDATVDLLSLLRSTICFTKLLPSRCMTGNMAFRCELMKKKSTGCFSWRVVWNTLFYCNVYDLENHKNKERGLKENDNPSEDIAVHLICLETSAFRLTV